MNDELKKGELASLYCGVTPNCRRNETSFPRRFPSKTIYSTRSLLWHDMRGMSHVTSSASKVTTKYKREGKKKRFPILAARNTTQRETREPDTPQGGERKEGIGIRYRQVAHTTDLTERLDLASERGCAQSLIQRPLFCPPPVVHVVHTFIHFITWSFCQKKKATKNIYK